jgi:hypothetical protein
MKNQFQESEEWNQQTIQDSKSKTA